MFKKILIAFLAALSFNQSSFSMEKAIINGDFKYVQKNLKGLLPEQKEVYLEIANNQIKFAQERYNDWIPNKGDCATLAAGLFLVYSAIGSFKTAYTYIEKSALGAGRVSAQISKLSEDMKIHLSVLENKIGNPYTFIGASFAAHSIVPMQISTNLFIEGLFKSILAIFLLYRSYGSHYKNLDYKNRLSIKQLIEMAPVFVEGEIQPEEPTRSLKVQFNEKIEEVKKAGHGYKVQAQEILEKIKLNLVKIRTQFKK